jgi:hypothetical protein
MRVLPYLMFGYSSPAEEGSSAQHVGQLDLALPEE